MFFIKLLIFIFILYFMASVHSINIVPIPGKPVYIQQTNSIWVFSFSKNSVADNRLIMIDLNKSFNTLQPPITDLSIQIVNSQCPVMHFAQALPSADGVSIDVFGAGSMNEIYEPSMTICQYNTQTSSWKQIKNILNAPLARRNAAFEVTQSNLTVIFGGNSERLTGLRSSLNYPNLWHSDVIIYDSNSNSWLPNPIKYTIGSTRANATITQIRDTNGQLVILGGSAINNDSDLDRVTNFPLANMSDIILFDPRTSIWNNAKTVGNSIPIPRKHHTTTLHPDGYTLIVIGGEYFNDSGAYLLNDVWTLNTKNVNNLTWSQPLIQGVGLYRSNHTSILIKDQIWVIAGTNATAKAVDIQLLNITNWTWSYLAISSSTTHSEQYASIGGVNGLIGIIVGVVGSVLLLSACVLLWWCRKRPSSIHSNDQLSKVKHSAALKQLRKKTLHSEHQLNKTTEVTDSIDCKQASKSSNHQSEEWSIQRQQQQTLLSNAYLTQLNDHIITDQHSSTDILENNNHFDENYQEHHTVTEDISRQSSFLYWDAPPTISLHMHQSLSSNAKNPRIDSNFMLTPIGSRASPTRFIAQQLQKPNEVDDLVPSREESATVCSLSTSEERPSSIIPTGKT